MECDICLIEWDSSKRIPRLLNCGHTFCEMCLKSILSKCISKNEKFHCPNCNVYQKIESEKDIPNLIKNYNLLTIAEKVDGRKTISSKLKLSKKEQDFSLNKEDQIKQLPLYESQLLEVVNRAPKFDIEKKCKKHNLPLHSFVEGHSTLLCDKCILENDKNAKPIPGIFAELRKNIDSSQLKACITKNEIKHLKMFLEAYLKQFENENSRKIEKIFDYFYGVVKYFHNSAKQLLTQCVSEQKAQILQSVNEMEKLSDELSNIEKELSEIYSLPDSGVFLEKIEIIRKVQHRMVNFLNYDWNFDLFSMKIGLNEKEEENLFFAIKNCYHIDVEFLEIENETPSIRQILKTDSTWQCICDEVSNPLNEVICPSCGLLRKIPTFNNNYFQNKIDVTDEEIHHYVLRRKEEEKGYKCLLEKESHSPRNTIKYLIDMEWFSLWNSYINNENFTDNDVNLAYSEINEIGILPPGPITNEHLVERDNNGNYVLKKELFENKDYKIVSKMVWEYFFLNYNGGPCIEIEEKNNNLKVLDISVDNYQSYTKIKEKYYSEHVECSEESEDENDYSEDTIVND